MAVHPLEYIYTGGKLEAASSVFSGIWTVSGTLNSVYIKVQNATGVSPSYFNLLNNGVGIFAGTGRLAVSASDIDDEKTGLSIAVTAKQDFRLDLESLASGNISGPIKLLMLVEDHAEDQQEVVYTTASLTNNASEDGTPTLVKMGILTGIETDRAARVRVYATAAERTADAAREVGTDPDDGSGVFLDVVTTSEKLAINLSPEAPFSNMESSRSANIPISVTNLGTTGTVEVTFKFNKIEE